MCFIYAKYFASLDFFYIGIRKVLNLPIGILRTTFSAHPNDYNKK